MRFFLSRSIAAVTIAATAACYSAQPAPEPESCAFGQYLHVENASGEQLEVVAYKGNSKIDIGPVGPGQTDLVIPNNDATGLNFQGVDSNGRPLGGIGGQAKAARLVMRPLCYKNPPSSPRRPSGGVEKGE